MSKRARHRSRPASTQVKKVIWAVDAFSESFVRQKQSLLALKRLLGTAEPEVQPLFILNPKDLKPAIVTGLVRRRELSPEAERRLEQIARASGFHGLRRPRILLSDGLSVRRSVKTFLLHALEKKADLIVLNTHARKGAQRLFVGSFAETLLLVSPIPVLIVNPSVKLEPRVKTLFFPTDFSPKSREVYEKMVWLAKSADLKVIVFHRVDFLFSEIGYPYSVPLISSKSLASLTRSREKDAEEWVRWATDHQVMASFRVADSSLPVPDAILKEVRRVPAPIIAMASQTGPVASALVGSVTRQVLRRADCPVLVIHPRAVEAKKRSRGVSHALGSIAMLSLL